MIGQTNLFTDQVDSETSPRITQGEDPCIICGRPSEYGAHGVRRNQEGDDLEGIVYSEYYCFQHYHAKKRGD